jgi:putative membrane protein
MLKAFIHWLIATIAIAIASRLVPGVSVDASSALIAAVVLGALNLFIRPILFVLTLPITILTLGLFSFVINAILVMVASYLVPGFHVASFWSAFLFAFVLSVVNWVFHFWGKHD